MLSVLFVIEGLDVMVNLQLIDKCWFHVFMLLLCIFKHIFVSHVLRVDIKQGGDQVSNVESRY